MPFTFEEKCFIKVLRQEKGWSAKRICSEFRQKKWAVSSVNDLLRKIDKTGSVERKVSSGCPWSIRTQRNISRANDLICSQENNPGTSKSSQNPESYRHIACILPLCIEHYRYRLRIRGFTSMRYINRLFTYFFLLTYRSPVTKSKSNK